MGHGHFDQVAAGETAQDGLGDATVQRGTHVLKALSVGAKACSGGRLYLYALAAAGDAGLNFLPSGKGRMSFGPTQVIQGPDGPKTVQLAFISGILPSPYPVWLDEQKRYFADVSFLSVMPAGYEGALRQLRDAQDAATADTVAAIVDSWKSAPTPFSSSAVSTMVAPTVTT